VSSPAAWDPAGVLQRHADNPSAFLALNSDTRHFRVPGVDGLIAYRPAGGRFLVQVGGVAADPVDADRLLDAFLATARQGGRRIVAVQLMRGDTDAYRLRGFRVNQFGSSYALRLADHTLAGKPFMKLRNKISRARRAGVEVAEVGVDVPRSPLLDARLAGVDQEWLRGKGAHTKELGFMVGERGGLGDGLRRLFVARRDDAILGYVSFSPVYGRTPGWLHDLSRRKPVAPPGTGELVTVTAIERFRAQGAAWLHFGLTPFAGLADDHELPGAASAIAAWAVRTLAERGDRLYPAADQLAYKLKWAPGLVQPEYIAFQRRVSPRAVWALARLTGAA